MFKNKNLHNFFYGIFLKLPALQHYEDFSWNVILTLFKPLTYLWTLFCLFWPIQNYEPMVYKGKQFFLNGDAINKSLDHVHLSFPPWGTLCPPHLKSCIGEILTPSHYRTIRTLKQPLIFYSYLYLHEIRGFIYLWLLMA